MPTRALRDERGNFGLTPARRLSVKFTVKLSLSRGTSGTSRAKRLVRWIGSRTNGSRTRAAHGGRDVHGPVEDAVAPGPRRRAQKCRGLLPRGRLGLGRSGRTPPHHPADRGHDAGELGVV